MAGNILIKYAASASPTFTSLNNLAGSSTFVAGAECLAINNTSNTYLDYIVSGLIKWSTTVPAAGTYQLNIYVYGSVNDTPTYPQDGSGNSLGTDNAVTFASLGDLNNALVFASSITLTATASKVYSFHPFSVAALFGGSLPNYWGLFITHGVTTANSTPLTTGSTISYTPVYAQYT